MSDDEKRVAWLIVIVPLFFLLAIKLHIAFIQWAVKQ